MKPEVRAVSESLGDASFYGFLREGITLRLFIQHGSGKFSEIICSWVNNLRIDLDWKARHGSYMLSIDGSIRDLDSGEIELFFDFGDGDTINVVCEDIEIV